MVYYDSLGALMMAVLEILPEASLGDDNDGQIIIYTNLRISDGLTTVPANELESMGDLER